MKLLTITILGLLIFVSSAYAAEKENHLFILSGQSNMVGLDPNISFVPMVEAAFGKDNVTIVKDAMNGQPILRWYKKWISVNAYKPDVTGDLYDRLINKVNAAIEGVEINTVTFVWMQGEADAHAKYGEVYGGSLKGLIKQLSEDLGDKEINFVIGRISDFDMNNSKFPHWTMVRDAQVEIANNSPRGAWVNTDDLNDGINPQGVQIKNDLHYSANGYTLLGKRFAEKSIELIKSNAQ